MVIDCRNVFYLHIKSGDISGSLRTASSSVEKVRLEEELQHVDRELEATSKEITKLTLLSLEVQLVLLIQSGSCHFLTLR